MERVDMDCPKTGKRIFLIQYSNRNKFAHCYRTQRPMIGGGERIPSSNSVHTMLAFQDLHYLQQDNILCDIKLETEDGTIVNGHRVVLSLASQYFYAMFTHFEESKKDHVILRNVDSTALKLIVSFLYNDQIMITEDNVQVLFHAANFLLLNDIERACCDFLENLLSPTNCLDTMELADHYGCTELLSSSESYVLLHFIEVAETGKFLPLSSDEIIKFISSDHLNVPSEEKVFEFVINWVKHNLFYREDDLPKLMEHVRLPLISKEYLQANVKNESLVTKSLQCKMYLKEALICHSLPYLTAILKPMSMKRAEPRRPVGLPKIILVVGGQDHRSVNMVEWYDPETNQWRSKPEILNPNYRTNIAVLPDQRIFAFGGFFGAYGHCTVDMLDLFSPSPHWMPTVSMLTKRGTLGVAVLNNCIYAIGGFNGVISLNSAEVFDCSTQNWRMISNMFCRRNNVGVGVLGNYLYAVGGNIRNKSLKSVERYYPKTDTWEPVSSMCIRRSGACIGVICGAVYAIGGYDGVTVHNSVEVYRPSVGFWVSVSPMHERRKNAGVVVLDDLLYVVGGENLTSSLNSVEVYNPFTNTWSMLTSSMNVGRSYAGVAVVDKTCNFNT